MKKAKSKLPNKGKGPTVLHTLHLDFFLIGLTSWHPYLTVLKCLLILFFNCNHWGAKKNKTQGDSLPTCHLRQGRAVGRWVMCGPSLGMLMAAFHRQLPGLSNQKTLRDAHPCLACSLFMIRRENWFKVNHLGGMSEFHMNLASTSQGRPHLGLLFFRLQKLNLLIFFQDWKWNAVLPVEWEYNNGTYSAPGLTGQASSWLTFVLPGVCDTGKW